MGLIVTGLSLVDFRSFAALELEPSPTTTILVGPNAVGKTNTVEALQMLTAGYSFRRPTPRQLIREGAERARASMRLEGDGRLVDLCCDITAQPSRRQFSRNGKRCQSFEVPESLMSVLFSPDDLSLVKRSASWRRGELDDFGREANRGYSNVLAAYGRAIEQRNRLLKEENPDLKLLDAWDASVALGGATLLDARLRLFSRLAPLADDIYGWISGGESLECNYECTLGDAALSMGKDALTDYFAKRLADCRPEDLRRQQTTVGPHRDDIRFCIEGKDARVYGSQGQQRSVVLALKMAEVEICSQIVGNTPLLLLDDVMSELDDARCEAVVSFAQQGIQTVITTTGLGSFSPALIEASKVVSFDER